MQARLPLGNGLCVAWGLAQRVQAGQAAEVVVIKDCKAHVDVPKWRIGGYNHDICNFHQGTELWIGDNYGSGADLQMTFGRGVAAMKAAIPADLSGDARRF